MTLPEPIAVTLFVTRILEQLGVVYFIGGSLASAVQGAARATVDADVVADLRPEHVAPFVHALGDAFYFDMDTIRTAVSTRGSFNLIHLKTMFKVDVFVNKGRPFDRAQLDRRVQQGLVADAGAEHSAYIASPEDTILAKLDWHRLGGEVSDRQWRDVIAVLKVQGARLDERYLATWAAQLGVEALLARAMAEAKRTQ
ncbi:MAG: hypothetical protein MUC51_00835 [Anaerolineae bacterium]|nr:hypothetical protein [Anaerolineae bacterium]